MIVIPNQNLFRVAGPSTTFKQAFDLADEVLQQGVRGITDLMVMPGLINLDFADIRTVMAGMGRALMGTGEASGDDRALRAAEAAIANPLLDEAIKGARGLIISICGGEDMKLMEVDEAAGSIKALVDPDADIIWGSAFVPELEGRIRVSVVATGIGAAELLAAAPTPLGAAEPATAIPDAAEQPALPLPEPVIRILPAAPVAEDELLLDAANLLVAAPPTETARGRRVRDARRAVARTEPVRPHGDGGARRRRGRGGGGGGLEIEPPAQALAPLRRRRLMFGYSAR